MFILATEQKLIIIATKCVEKDGHLAHITDLFP